MFLAKKYRMNIIDRVDCNYRKIATKIGLKFINNKR